MKQQSRARPAFTLLELLVVISIIALLASITVSAVFRLLSSQKETNTNTHLRKIEMTLQQQVKATRDQIRKEPIPDAIFEITKDQNGNINNDRARALHMKLRMRQEFPQNFAEVLPAIPPTITINGKKQVYDGKDYFKRAIKSPFMSGPNAYFEPINEMQSAALLVLILSQGKGGATTSPEQIARTTLLDFPQANNQPAIQLRLFVDEWQRPIGFRRLADEDMTDALVDLNQQPYVSGTGNADPDDPTGQLKLPNNYWFQPQNGQNYRDQAKGFLASNTPGSRPYLPDPFDGKNRGPFAFSAGRDGNFFTSDDLYSYRQQQSGRGN